MRSMNHHVIRFILTLALLLGGACWVLAQDGPPPDGEERPEGPPPGQDGEKPDEAKSPATAPDKPAPATAEHVTPDRFGIGGEFAFGLTTNLKNSYGDFPMNYVRRFFTNRFYGINENITADVGADRLNRPEGDNLVLDFFFNIKPKDPKDPQALSIKAFASLNFETAFLGTMASSGTHTNRFFMRDIYLTFEDLLIPNLDVWAGDRQRGGLPMFSTMFRPSQDDVRMRGLGADYLLNNKFKISLDFGFHWLVKTTETINADLSVDPEEATQIIKEEYVGYVPLGVGGNPLTYDYFLFIDDTNSQRMRKIQTLHGRFEMPLGGDSLETGKMVLGIGGAYEWVFASNGNKFVTNRGDQNYGNWLFPKNNNEGLEYPFDWGFKLGADLDIHLSRTATLRAGIGYSGGISTLPTGPSREFLELLTQDTESGLQKELREFAGKDGKRLNQQRSTTFGVSFELAMENGNFQAEVDGKLGSFLGNGEGFLRNLSADRHGQAEGSLFLINARYTHFFGEYFKLAGDFTTELHLLSLQEIDELVSKFQNTLIPGSGDKMGYIVRFFILPGLNIGERTVDGNGIYAQLGFSLFNRTVQMLEELGTERKARIQFYMGLQSRILF